MEELRTQKEIFVENKGKRLAEKLGTKWYNEGEKSTRYFLRILNRSSPDNFKELVDNAGNSVTAEAEISKLIVDFYKNLYETYDKNQVVNDDDQEFFNELISISADQQNEVTAAITAEELYNTLKTCRESAPGPDGISYGIYRELWPLCGPILLESWRYTLSSGELAPSHKTSYLKLIPKVGKDLKNLTNWRPITLSNCDHKLFTKIYANRICERIAPSIGEQQTAYLKGRIINDNIRAMLSSIKVVDTEEDLDALLVSLDAKKAFDSVEHSYIEQCLIKFGLQNFVKIFRILYSELRSDILVNGTVVKGYKILRGVKQGDALSCVLFIMCMEPLIRNV